MNRFKSKALSWLLTASMILSSTGLTTVMGASGGGGKLENGTQYTVSSLNETRDGNNGYYYSNGNIIAASDCVLIKTSDASMGSNGSYGTTPSSTGDRSVSDFRNATRSVNIANLTSDGNYDYYVFKYAYNNISNSSGAGTSYVGYLTGAILDAVSFTRGIAPTPPVPPTPTADIVLSSIGTSTAPIMIDGATASIPFTAENGKQANYFTVAITEIGSANAGESANVTAYGSGTNKYSLELAGLAEGAKYEVTVAYAAEPAKFATTFVQVKAPTPPPAIVLAPIVIDNPGTRNNPIVVDGTTASFSFKAEPATAANAFTAVAADLNGSTNPTETVVKLNDRGDYRLELTNLTLGSSYSVDISYTNETTKYDMAYIKVKPAAPGTLTVAAQKADANADALAVSVTADNGKAYQLVVFKDNTPIYVYDGTGAGNAQTVTLDSSNTYPYTAGAVSGAANNAFLTDDGTYNVYGKYVGEAKYATGAATITVDRVAPAMPIISLTKMVEGDYTIVGTGEASATVTMNVTGVNPDVTTKVNANGTWAFSSKKFTANQVVTITVADAAGNVSMPWTMTVEAAPAVVNALKVEATAKTVTNADALEVKVTADNGKAYQLVVFEVNTPRYVYSGTGTGNAETVTLTSSNTALYTPGVVGAAMNTFLVNEGIYKVSGKYVGDVGYSGNPVTIISDTTAPAKPVVAVNEIVEGTTTISGTGEANATVTMIIGSNTAATTTVKADGTWTLTFTAVAAGDVVKITVTDAAGNASAPWTMTVVAAPVAVTPLVVAATAKTVTNADELEVKVTAEAGKDYQLVVFEGTTPIYVYTGRNTGATAETVTLNANNTVLYTPGVVGAAMNTFLVNEGVYKVSGKYVGDKVYSGNPVTIISDTTAPAKPVVGVNEIVEGTTTISGTGEAGATVTMINGSNTAATATVKADGTWTLTFTAVAVGDVVKITVADAAGNDSAPWTTTVKTNIVDAPTITKVESLATSAKTQASKETGIDYITNDGTGVKVTAAQAQNAPLQYTVTKGTATSKAVDVTPGTFDIASNPFSAGDGDYTISVFCKNDTTKKVAFVLRVQSTSKTAITPVITETITVKTTDITVNDNDYAKVIVYTNTTNSTTGATRLGTMTQPAMGGKDGNWTFTITQPLTVGEYVVVEATDVFGNTATAGKVIGTVSIIEAPVIAAVAPVQSTGAKVVDVKATISGIDYLSNDGAGVKITATQTQNEPLQYTVQKAGGAVSGINNVTSSPFVTTASLFSGNGDYTINVFCRDDKTSVVSFVLRIDTATTIAAPVMTTTPNVQTAEIAVTNANYKSVAIYTNDTADLTSPTSLGAMTKVTDWTYAVKANELKAGEYVVVEATDYLDRTSVVAKQIAAVSLTAPVVANVEAVTTGKTAVATGANYLTNDNQGVKVTLNATKEKLQYTVDGKNPTDITLVGNAFTIAPAPFTAGNGDYTIKIFCKDDTTSFVEFVLKIKLNADAPVFAASTFELTGPTVTISGTSADIGGTVELFKNGSTTNFATAVVDANGAWTVSMGYGNFKVDDKITAKVTSLTGDIAEQNTAATIVEATGFIKIDLSLPDIKGTYNGTSYTTTKDRMAISVNKTGSIDAEVTLTGDGISTTRPVAAPSVTFTPTAGTVFAGAYTVTATYGNNTPSKDADVLNVFVDAEVPTIGTVTEDQNVRLNTTAINADIFDNSGVAKIEVKVADVVRTTVDLANVGTATGTIENIAISLNAADLGKAISLVVTDAAGNVTTQSLGTVLTDVVTGDTIAIASIVGANKVGNDYITKNLTSNIEVKITGKDGKAVTAEISGGGLTPVIVSPAVTLVSGAATATIGTNGLSLADKTNYTITVKYVEDATVNATATLKTDAAALGVITIAAITDRTAVITGTNETRATNVDVTIGNETKAATINGTTWTINASEFTAATAMVGTNKFLPVGTVISVKQTSAAGATNAVTTTVAIETQPIAFTSTPVITKETGAFTFNITADNGRAMEMILNEMPVTMPPVDARVKGAASFAIAPADVNTVGAVTQTVTFTPDAAIPEDQYIITVKYADADVNAIYKVALQPYIVDITAPIVLTPTNPVRLNTTAITADVFDNSGTAKIDVVVEGSIRATLPMGNVGKATSTTLETIAVTLNALDLGKAISLVVTDAAGNVKTHSLGTVLTDVVTGDTIAIASIVGANKVGNDYITKNLTSNIKVNITGDKDGKAVIAEISGGGLTQAIVSPAVTLVSGAATATIGTNGLSLADKTDYTITVKYVEEPAIIATATLKTDAAALGVITIAAITDRTAVITGTNETRATNVDVTIGTETKAATINGTTWTINASDFTAATAMVGTNKFLPAGTDISVKQTSASGLTNAVTTTVAIETQPIAFTSTPVITNKTGAFTFNITADNGRAMEMKLNEMPVIMPPPAITEVAGTASFATADVNQVGAVTQTVTFTPDAAIPEDQYIITVKYTDTAVDAIQPVVAQAYIVDMTDPTVLSTTNPVRLNTTDITADVFDNSGKAMIDVVVDGSIIATLPMGPVGKATSTTLETIAVTLNASHLGKAISLVVTDAAGNVTTKNLGTVLTDVVTESLAITNIDGANTLANGGYIRSTTNGDVVVDISGTKAGKFVTATLSGNGITAKTSAQVELTGAAPTARATINLGGLNLDNGKTYTITVAYVEEPTITATTTLEIDTTVMDGLVINEVTDRAATITGTKHTKANKVDVTIGGVTKPATITGATWSVNVSDFTAATEIVGTSNFLPAATAISVAQTSAAGVTGTATTTVAIATQPITIEAVTPTNNQGAFNFKVNAGNGRAMAMELKGVSPTVITGNAIFTVVPADVNKVDAVDYNVTFTPAANIPEGDYTITVKYTDANVAAMPGAEAKTVAYKIDLTKPLPVINGTLDTRTTEITVNDSAYTAVEIWVSADSNSANATKLVGMTESNGVWSTGTLAKYLTEGNYVFAKATNALGTDGFGTGVLVAKSTRNLTMNETDATLNPRVGGTVLNPQSGAITITGTGTIAEELQVVMSGMANDITVSTTVNGLGNWSVTFGLVTTDGDAIRAFNGAVTITPSYKNITTVGVTPITLTFDNVAPSSNSSVFAITTTPINNETTALNVIADTDVTNVYGTITNKGRGIIANITAIKNPSGTWDFTGLTLKVGDVITIYAKDAAGNVTATPLTVTVVAVVAGKITLSVTYNETNGKYYIPANGNPVTEAIVEIKGGKTGEAVEVAIDRIDGVKAYGYVGDTVRLITAPASSEFQQGERTVTADYTNPIYKGKGYAADPMILVVDKVAPLADEITIAPITIDATEATITLDAKDASSTVEMTAPSAVLGTTTDTTTYKVDLSGLTLKVGNVLTFKVTDLSGNVTTKTATVVDKGAVKAITVAGSSTYGVDPTDTTKFFSKENDIKVLVSGGLPMTITLTGANGVNETKPLAANATEATFTAANVGNQYVPGTYTVTVNYVDPAYNADGTTTVGGTKTIAATVVIDRTAPVVPTITNAIIHNETTAITGTATGEAGGKVEILGTDKTTVIGTGAILADGTYTAALTQKLIVGDTHYARITDAAGNVSTLTTSFTVVAKPLVDAIAVSSAYTFDATENSYFLKDEDGASTIVAEVVGTANYPITVKIEAITPNSDGTIKDADVTQQITGSGTVTFHAKNSFGLAVPNKPVEYKVTATYDDKGFDTLLGEASFTVVENYTTDPKGYTITDFIEAVDDRDLSIAGARDLYSKVEVTVNGITTVAANVNDPLPIWGVSTANLAKGTVITVKQTLKTGDVVTDTETVVYNTVSKIAVANNVIDLPSGLNGAYSSNVNHIKVNLTADAGRDVTITATNPNGQDLGTQTITATGTAQEITFNKLSNVPLAGTYTITAEYVDAADMISGGAIVLADTTATTTVSIITGTPVAPIVSPVTNRTTSISGTTVDKTASIKLYTLANGVLTEIPNANVTVNGTNWTATIPCLESGTVITAKATDTANNVTTDAQAIATTTTVTYDSTIAVAITGTSYDPDRVMNPVADQQPIVISGTTANVAGFVTGNVLEVILTKDGVDFTTTVAFNTDGTWSATVPVNANNTNAFKGLDDGDITVSAKILEKDGISATQATLVLDKTAPAAPAITGSVIDGTDSTAITTRSKTILGTATGEAGATVYVYYGDEAVVKAAINTAKTSKDYTAANGNAIVAADGKWSIAVSALIPALTELENGKAIGAITVDLAGNVTQAMVTPETVGTTIMEYDLVINDLANPFVNLAGTNAAVTFTGSYKAGERVVVSLEGFTFTGGSTEKEVTYNTVDGTWSVTFGADAGERLILNALAKSKDGEALTVTAKYIGTVANTATSKLTTTIYPDVTAPTAPAITNAELTNRTKVVTVKSSTVYPFAAANDGGTIELFANGTKVDTTNVATVDATGLAAWRLTLAANLKATDVITVKETDCAGNVSVASAGKTVVEAPETEGVVPPTDEDGKVANLDITTVGGYEIYDVNGVKTVYINNANVGTIAVTGTGQNAEPAKATLTGKGFTANLLASNGGWTFNITNLVDLKDNTTYVLKVEYLNTANNGAEGVIGTDVVNIVVDTAVPNALTVKTIYDRPDTTVSGTGLNRYATAPENYALQYATSTDNGTTWSTFAAIAPASITNDGTTWSVPKAAVGLTTGINANAGTMLKFKQIDRASNESAEVVTTVIVTNKPNVNANEIKITSPVDGVKLPSTTASLTVTGTATPGEILTVQIDTLHEYKKTDVLVAADGTFTCKFGNDTTAIFAEGSHTVKVMYNNIMSETDPSVNYSKQVSFYIPTSGGGSTSGGGGGGGGSSASAYLPIVIKNETLSKTPRIYGTSSVNKDIRVFIDNVIIGNIKSDDKGNWTVDYPTAKDELKLGEHEIRVQYMVGEDSYVGKTSKKLKVVEAVADIVFTVGSNEYSVGGQKFNSDVAPFIDTNDRTMLPFRAFVNATGIDDKDVKWDDATKTATITREDGKEIVVTIGEKFISIDGVIVPIDTSAVIVDGRILLPLRATFNALSIPDEQIIWDAEARRVTVLDKPAVVAEAVKKETK